MSQETQNTVLYVNASVYSPVDPFATAILVDGPTISWLGSEEAARAMAGEKAQVVDVNGAVITPSFVGHQRVGHGHAAVTAEQGYGAVELLSDNAEELAAATDAATRAGLTALPILIHSATSEDEVLAADTSRPCLGIAVEPDQEHSRTVDSVSAHLIACTSARRQAVVVCESETGGASSETVEAVIEAARAAVAEVGERAFKSRGHRIVGVGELSERQCEELAEYALTVSSRPGAAPLTPLARAGVPVTLMTAAENPWQAVKDALEAGEQDHRTSARAAFLALTRGVWRAQRDAQPLAGQLAPGAEASMAMWDADSLMVQQAQGTGASWSTDPRARTPALPALDDPRLSVCERTVAGGTTIFG